MSERDIFTAAREMTDAAARSAYLDGACGGDAGLRARVEALLRAHDQPDSLLDHPAVAPQGPAVGDSRTLDHQGGAPADDEAPLGFLEPATRPDSLGRLGHYEVLQVLGRGGFGIVFRAFDEVLQRVVALKVLTPQLAATSPARKRFLREARSSAQVRHENVVQVYEVAEQPLPYLAMEFIPGETLQQKLNRTGPLDVPEVLRIGRQIAEGLAAAHATDLIHRDIKPGNVLLEGGHHKVKITDFGLARAADDASISQSGVIAGTPMYMAPEQALGQTLDQRADLFSLGSVLYQMVAGRPPFRANTAVAVLKRVAEDQPRVIREIIPETPQWLCDIIAKLHAKNPDDRYQSAREVADVLADCEAQLTVNAKLKDYSRIPRSQPQPSGPRPRLRTRWAAASAVLLLLGGGFGFTEATGVTNVRGTVIRLFTPEGTLVVEVDDPGVRVKIDGSDITITGVGAHEIRLKPGRYSVEASKDGKLVRQELVSVTRNGRQVVRVSQEALPPEVKVKSDAGFKALLNGKNLSGWVVESGDPKGWEVKDGEILGRSPDFRSQCFLLTERDYSDFVLRLEFALEWGTSAAVALRALPGQTVSLGGGGRIPYHPLLKLTDESRSPEEPTGAHNFLKDGQPSPTLIRPAALKPIGEWNQLELEVRGETLKASVNGQVVFDIKLDRSGKAVGAHLQGLDADKGRIGLQRHTGLIRYRKIEIKELPSGVRIESGAKDKPSSPAIAPFTDADVQRIAALPAAGQVEEVRKELKRRNPGFDGKMETKIEGGVVTEFQIVTDKVTDIAPIRVFDALRVLVCSGTTDNGKPNGKPNGRLEDLTPLQGMNLAALTRLGLWNTKVSDAGMAYFKDCKGLTHLGLWNTKVSDAGLANFEDCKNLTLLWLNDAQVGDAGLAHFHDCKDLEDLNLAGTKVSDVGLAHFKDCKNLKHLWLDRTQVGDAGLAQFKGMPLKGLTINNTGITDLTPLQGMPLEAILLTPKNITKGLDILRDMKSLKTIGISWKQSWPAAEFWERHDKGEFK